MSIPYLTIDWIWHTCRLKALDSTRDPFWISYKKLENWSLKIWLSKGGPLSKWRPMIVWLKSGASMLFPEPKLQRSYGSVSQYSIHVIPLGAIKTAITLLHLEIFAWNYYVFKFCMNHLCWVKYWCSWQKGLKELILICLFDHGFPMVKQSLYNVHDHAEL